MIMGAKGDSGEDLKDERESIVYSPLLLKHEKKSSKIGKTTFCRF